MISKKLKNLKIATILPYKENYSYEKASAASLWVAEFFKKSKHRDTNIIYGYTQSKNFLTKNYVNIDLKSINSKFLSYLNLFFIIAYFYHTGGVTQLFNLQKIR